MSDTTLGQLITLFTLLVGSGGLVGAVYALLRLRPEAGQITVDAAHKVVQFQAEVIQRIEDENRALRDEVAELRPLRQEVADLRREVAQLRRRVGGR